MILSYEFIRLFRKIGLIHIEPFCLDQLNPNSYDVRLGNWFSFVEWEWQHNPPRYEPQFSAPHRIADGQQVCIGRGTLLGMTKERIGGRGCVVTKIHAKSTTRRKGITVCDDAGFGDIGYYDQHWTVELEGHSQRGDPRLTVGECFAQVEFSLATPTAHPYKGQYAANDWPAAMIPKLYRRAYDRT